MRTLPATVVVASRRAERTSLADRRAGPHLSLVPEGLCHGLCLGAASTLCGLPAAELAVFPGLDYESATFLLRCQECTQQVG